ncbi:MAG: NDP-sugar synthase [Myxococcota bacterium]
MILGAGLGTRMQPLTRRWPKPALPILDEPLVIGLIRTLAVQGVEAVIVNAHAHAEILLEALATAPIPAELSLEPQLLGSGGGIRRAGRFLESSRPFVVVNADMRLDLDLSSLLAAHAQGGSMATLALRDDSRKRSFGSIGYDGAGAVRRITSLVDLGGEVASGLFVGVHVMDPEIFRSMPDRDAFEIMTEVYVPALRKGQRIHTWLQPSPCEWSPVGEPRELLETNLSALAARSRAEPGATFVAEDATVNGEIAPPAWVGAGAEIARGASVGPWAVIGAGARVAAGTRVERALLLPGARPPAGANLSGAIAFDEEVWRDV